MKATYIDFISANPNCSNYADNKDAQRIFDFLKQNMRIDAFLLKKVKSKQILNTFAQIAC